MSAFEYKIFRLRISRIYYISTHVDMSFKSDTEIGRSDIISIVDINKHGKESGGHLNTIQYHFSGAVVQPHKIATDKGQYITSARGQG